MGRSVVVRSKMSICECPFALWPNIANKWNVCTTNSTRILETAVKMMIAAGLRSRIGRKVVFIEANPWILYRESSAMHTCEILAGFRPVDHRDHWYCAWRIPPKIRIESTAEKDDIIQLCMKIQMLQSQKDLRNDKVSPITLFHGRNFCMGWKFMVNAW